MQWSKEVHGYQIITVETTILTAEKLFKLTKTKTKQKILKCDIKKFPLCLVCNCKFAFSSFQQPPARVSCNLRYSLLQSSCTGFYDTSAKMFAWFRLGHAEKQWTTSISSVVKFVSWKGIHTRATRRMLTLGPRGGGWGVFYQEAPG